MKRTQLLAAAALGAFALAAFGLVAGGNDYDMDWFTIDGGGASCFSGDFELTGTIGQPDAGPLLASGDFTLAGGFWAGGSGDPSSEIAAVYDFNIIEGTLLAGGLPEIEESDDAWLHTRSGFGGTLIDLHHMEVQFLATTTVDAPAMVDLTIESKINEPSGSTQVRMRNWNTGQYELLGQYTVGLEDNVRQFPGLDATRYVSNLGEIDMRVKVLVFRPILAYTFQSYIDQIEIAVHE